MSEETDIVQDPNIPVEAEPSSFKLIATLGIAGLLSGVLIVGSYLITLPLIEANRAEALQKAIYQVLPECASFISLELKDGKLAKFNKETSGKKQINQKESSKIFAGFNSSKELIGFAIPAAEPGFQDIISAIYGYDATKEVIIGFEVLESKETPGLGDKIFKDEAFKLNFKALAVSPEIKPVKPGQKTKANEVETITGATISSKAVVRLLNNGTVMWKQAIAEYIESNELALATEKHE